jgi:hypothetical protein
MTDDFTFDWAALAPIEEIATLVERICVARGLDGLWYSSTPGGIPVKGCRINGVDGVTLAVLTLQGYYPDQTHLRLQPAAHAADPRRSRRSPTRSTPRCARPTGYQAPGRCSRAPRASYGRRASGRGRARTQRRTELPTRLKAYAQGLILLTKAFPPPRLACPSRFPKVYPER